MKMRILIVDDEPIVRKGMTAIIHKENSDWRVIGQEPNGEAALRFMEREVPDILITDIKMVSMDGICLSKIVRRKWPEMLILVVSGYGEFEFAKEAVRFGAMDYLLKPTAPSELICALGRAEETLRKQRDAHVETLLLQEGRGRESMNRQIEDAVTYMKHHYNQDLSTRQMAEILHLNTNYFCDLFKKETGMTFLDYLTKIRISMAKKLLREKVSVRTYEVAEMVGYSDSRYFARIFKRETGMTPSEYRENN